MWRCQYSDTHHETSFRKHPENIFSCHLFIFYSQCYTVLADNIGVSHQRLLSRIPRRYRRQIPTKFFRPGPVKILRGLINVPVLLLDHSQIQVWQVPEKKTSWSLLLLIPARFGCRQNIYIYRRVNFRYSSPRLLVFPLSSMWQEIPVFDSYTV